MLMKRRDKLSDEELAAYLDDMLSPSYDVDEVYERDCDYDDASCCCFEPASESASETMYFFAPPQRKRIRPVSSPNRAKQNIAEDVDTLEVLNVSRKAMEKFPSRQGLLNDENKRKIAEIKERLERDEFPMAGFLNADLSEDNGEEDD